MLVIYVMYHKTEMFSKYTCYNSLKEMILMKFTAFSAQKLSWHKDNYGSTATCYNSLKEMILMKFKQQKN